MDKKLLIKTFISCVLGAVLWCIIDFVICLVKKESFVDTFFTPYNIVELVIMITISGYVYYSTQKKKNNNK